MQDYTITGEQLQAFRQRLVWEEKSPATIEKYLRDAADFTAWLDGRAASKAAAGAWKAALLDAMLSPATINVKRAAVNRKYTFEHAGLDTLKICRHFMTEEEKKNLAAACRYFAVDPGESHRALSDALAAHHLYQELKNRYFLDVPAVFAPQPLIYKVKREQPASKKQKEVLRELLKYHRINVSVQIDYLSRNEISRLTDKIILQYGRIKRGDKNV